MFGKKHLRANTNTPMIAVLMLVESKDPEQDSVGKAHRESEDIRDGLKAALQTLTELIREGLFLRGHFKLASLRQGGDTGSASRELWVRVNGKWSVEMNQSHMTLLDDFLLLSPPTITFTTAFFCFFKQLLLNPNPSFPTCSPHCLPLTGIHREIHRGGGFL